MNSDSGSYCSTYQLVAVGIEKDVPHQLWQPLCCVLFPPHFVYSFFSNVRFSYMFTNINSKRFHLSNWQENYLNYRPSFTGKDDNGLKRLSLIARAAESIGDGDIFNVQIRRYRQWQLSQASVLSSCIVP